MRSERELDLREEDKTLVSHSRRLAGERRAAAGDCRTERCVRGGVRGSPGGRGSGHAGKSALRQLTTGHSARRDRSAIPQDRLGEAARWREGLLEARGVLEVAATEASESRRGRDQRSPGARCDVHAAEDEGVELRGRVTHGTGAGVLQRPADGVATSGSRLTGYLAGYSLSPAAVATGECA